MSPGRARPGRSDPIAAALAAVGVVVLDGGLATQLEAEGADLSDPLWSASLLLDDPQRIVRAHLAFFRAGARVATTASYQASFEGLARRGLGHEAAVDVLRSSVSLADEARSRYRAERRPEDPDPLLVAASVGPYGATLADGSEYRGRYGRTVAELRAFHEERMTVLAAAGADLLACETIPEIEEAEAVAGLVDELGTVGWLSLTCADGARLRSGAPVEEAFAIGDAADGILAVGVNCTAPAYVDELLDRARAVTAKPLVVYPNSGERWDPTARAWRAPSVDGPVPRSTLVTGRSAGGSVAEQAVDAEAARRWVGHGALLVGGCCRVGPGTIAEIASSVSGWSARGNSATNRGAIASAAPAALGGLGPRPN